jgi:hypothetical protein
MILLAKRKLGIFFVTTFGMQGSLLYYIDRLLRQVQGDVKLVRETHLYLQLVFLVVYGALVLRLYLGSRGITRELRRIAQLAARGSYNNERAVRTLGPFGEHINEILATVLAISDKRRLKIGAQKILIETLEQLVDTFVIVTDISGLVLGHSAVVREQLGATFQSGIYLGDIIKEFEVSRYVAYFSVNNEKLSEGAYVCYPIYNAEATVHYLLIVQRSYNLPAHVADYLDEVAQKALRKKSFLNRIQVSQID